jgi:hypothetical protein
MTTGDEMRFVVIYPVEVVEKLATIRNSSRVPSRASEA